MSNINEETINLIKQKALIEEVVQDFITLKKNGANLIGLCPWHNEKTPSFYVSPAKQICKCFGCGKSADAIGFLMETQGMSYPVALKYLATKYNIEIEEESKVYAVPPPWKNKTDLSDKVVKWFEARKISQSTLEKAKVSEGMEWMPQLESEVNAIHFNYFMDDELVNIKYRGPKKAFKLYKNAKLLFYNIDSIKGKKNVFITEGELDVLALIEAGYVNEDSGVVSVPNGAGVNNNLSYVDNCIHLFEGIENIYIGTDNDIPGRALREQLANRFGKDRCKYIEWKDKKDANDVLIEHGIQGVIDCCSNPSNFNLEGSFTVSDYSYEIDDMYVNGLDKGVNIGLRDFDLNIVPGYITLVTGIPNDGKSSFVDEMCMRLLVNHDQKGAFYSPENKPTQLHFSKLARKLTGKHWDGPNRMSKKEVQDVKDFLDKKVFFIKPEKDFSLQSILTTVKGLKELYGIKWFVIDAWNKLEHKGVVGDTGYIGRALDELAVFCEANLLHCFLVAHPRKMEKEKGTERFVVPNMYSVAHSADFANKADNGLCVYVDWEVKTTHIYRQKVKFDHWGYKGVSEYKYDPDSTRLFPIGLPENKSWISGEEIVYAKKDAFESIQSDFLSSVKQQDDPF